MWLLLTVTAMAAVFAVGLFVLLGRPLALPEWAVVRAENVLDQQFPALDVSLGGLSLVVERNLHPRIRATDLVLRERTASSAIELEEVEISISGRKLFERRVVPRSVRVSGVYLSLRRLEDGAFNLSLGDGGQPADALDTSTSLSELGTRLDSVFAMPALAELSEVRVEALHLRYEDVRAGRGWSIDGGNASLTREGNEVELSANLVALGARSYVSSVEVSARMTLGSNVAHLGLTFEDMPADEIASQSPALAWLNILNAPISGSLRAATDSDGVLGPTSVALQIGEGVLQPEDNVRPVPFHSAHTYLTYDPGDQSLTLDEFSLQAGWVGARASGKALLRQMDLGLPQELLVQLQFSQLDLNPNNLADSPISLDSAFADFRLRLNPFELNLGQLVLSQKGERLSLSGHLVPDDAHWKYAVDGKMTQLKRDSVLGAWPVRAKPKLRTWINDNIRAIDLRDINLALRSKGAEPPDVYLDFLFSGLELKFMKNMPPLRNASGVAAFEKNQFLVGAESGFVTADEGGSLDVTGTGFVVHDTRLKESPATVRLKATGPVTAALSLLNRKPLRVMDKARLPVDLAEGQVTGVGQFDLVLKNKIKPDDVQYGIDLDIRDVKTSHFIKDKVIAGNMTGHVNNTEVVLQGPGVVGALPVTAKWRSAIGPDHDGSSQLTGTAELSQLAVDEFGVGFPANTLSGKSKTGFTMDIRRGEPPVMKLTTDLKGLGVRFAPLGYSKNPDETGKADLTLTIKQPPHVDAFSYEAKGLSVEGSVTLQDAGGLDRVTMEAFEVSNWLSGSGAIIGRGEGLAPAISLTSGSFDVRGLPTGESGDSGGGAGASQDDALGPISANLQRVQITESYYLTNFSGQFQDTGGFAGEFTGLFNGTAAIQGEMVPKDGAQAFKITSDRGGDVITAIGVARASGPGNMVLHLLPGKTSGSYDGTVTLREVKILDAPAFVELLNAVSVVGLIEQLSGPGILLTEIAGRFHLTPAKLTIHQGSAVGPAMGISLDGAMDLASGLLDFQGAFSPFYIINSVGRVISKKGEGLIAFNYRLQGTADDLRISVNPLSALTPGFFREIFRVPGSETVAPPVDRPPLDSEEDSQGTNSR